MANRGVWVTVAPAADFAVGERRTVRTDRHTILVIHTARGLFAVEDRCSHDEWELVEGEVRGEEIVCPRHAARFDLRTGRALSPPAWRPLTTFPVRHRAGEIQVRAIPLSS